MPPAPDRGATFVGLPARAVCGDAAAGSAGFLLAFVPRPSGRDDAGTCGVAAAGSVGLGVGRPVPRIPGPVVGACGAAAANDGREGLAAAGAGRAGCVAVRGAGHLPRSFRATDPAPRLPSRDVVGACGMAAAGFVELAVRLPLRETDPAPRPPGHDTSSMGGVAAAGCLGPAGGLLRGGALDGCVEGNGHRGHTAAGAG